eukprot:CAMPEP_0197463930 /NCGR_PEP_ID=MMETSP1175-20131217/63079_1 /TAXON_ID=1003142 /ORGANISM="Triceratium dubium, Strain CCMP147" /LENGTH=153 /DNA_ID=CAMNT_0042999799 /DNA_START=99 /DNA_END=560 /DNA_ORIENTATION=-
MFRPSGAMAVLSMALVLLLSTSLQSAAAAASPLRPASAFLPAFSRSSSLVSPWCCDDDDDDQAVSRTHNPLRRIGDKSRRNVSPTRLFGRRRGSGKAKKERVSKSDFPSKVCVVCGRPFTWRKKWERCWDEVTCCSKKCNAERRANKNIGNVE